MARNLRGHTAALEAQWRANTRFPGEEKPPRAAGSNTGGIFLNLEGAKRLANELLTENSLCKNQSEDNADSGTVKWTISRK